MLQDHLAGDVAVLLGDVLFGHDPEFTTVILDPPAAGLALRVVDILLARPPANRTPRACATRSAIQQKNIAAAIGRVESV